jgi:hypothetical protein
LKDLEVVVELFLALNDFAGNFSMFENLVKKFRFYKPFQDLQDPLQVTGDDMATAFLTMRDQATNFSGRTIQMIRHPSSSEHRRLRQFCPPKTRSQRASIGIFDLR